MKEQCRNPSAQVCQLLARPSLSAGGQIGGRKEKPCDQCHLHTQKVGEDQVVQ